MKGNPLVQFENIRYIVSFPFSKATQFCKTQYIFVHEKFISVIRHVVRRVFTQTWRSYTTRGNHITMSLWSSNRLCILDYFTVGEALYSWLFYSRWLVFLAVPNLYCGSCCRWWGRVTVCRPLHNFLIGMCKPKTRAEWAWDWDWGTHLWFCRRRWNTSQWYWYVWPDSLLGMCQEWIWL